MNFQQAQATGIKSNLSRRTYSNYEEDNDYNITSTRRGETEDTSVWSLSALSFDDDHEYTVDHRKSIASPFSQPLLSLDHEYVLSDDEGGYALSLTDLSACSSPASSNNDNGSSTTNQCHYEDMNKHTMTLSQYVDMALSISLPSQLEQLGFHPQELTNTLIECTKRSGTYKGQSINGSVFDMFQAIMRIFASKKQSEKNEVPEEDVDYYNFAWSSCSFDWPIQEMASFQYGMVLDENQKAVDFECTGVVIDLPKVDAEGVTRLSHFLKHVLFQFIGGPVESVTIPNTNNVINGVAFIEFTSKRIAAKAMTAVDGLQFHQSAKPFRARMFSDANFLDDTFDDVNNDDDDSLSSSIVEDRKIEEESIVDHQSRMAMQVLRNKVAMLESKASALSQDLQDKTRDHELCMHENGRLHHELIAYRHERNYQQDAENSLYMLQVQLEQKNRASIDLTQKLNSYVQKVEHLRLRVQNLNGRNLDDVGLSTLVELERTVEHSLHRIRAAKHVKEEELARKRATATSDSEASSSMMCVICLTNEKSVLFLPCRHLCLCEDCSSSYDELEKCPVCRVEIEEKMSIFA